MRALDLIRMTAGALLANPMRSFLTMLGIIIGVGSMVSMAAIGAGAQSKVAEEIRSFGANVLMINPGAQNRDGVRGAAGTRQTLTLEDAQAIAQLPSIAAAAPSVAGTAQIVHGNRNWSTTVNGTLNAHFRIREWHLKAGHFFTPEDERGGGKVVVLGAMVAEKLFGAGDPIGQQIRILSTPFEVIGVLRPKGTVGSGQSQDDVAFVPLPAAMMRLVGSANAVNREAVGYILASATRADMMTSATREIESLLRQRHRIQQASGDDFLVTSASAILAAQQASTRTVSFLLGSIAAVSLGVGGISIMNIMLVSVTERTREIGLRLAIGARRRDIRNQFLLEAVALCVFGGMLGVLLGGGAAWLIAQLVGWPVLLQPATAAMAVGFSGSVGTFFGYDPARLAARLQPVVALRT
jgi:putative ABC transport system permease protein